MTPRELGVVVAALVAAVLVALAAGNGAVLITRPFWVDEVHTVLLAGRASPMQVVGDLRAGADFGPPLVPLSAWVLGKLAGGLGPALLRLASLTCVLGALVITYLVLRRRFHPVASLAGILAVGSQELVITHSYEGRFYGPWLLTVALFAWALATPHRRARLAITAVLLCTVHWYGVITLGLMLGGVAVFAAARRGLRSAAADYWPATVGLIALAACIPLSIGQRQALSVSTWVPDFAVSQLSALIDRLFVGWAYAVAMLAITYGAVRRARNGTSRWSDAVASAGNHPGVLALFTLLAMPVALALFSLAGQPSMLPRYAIPVVLALGPIAALAAEALSAWPQRVFALWLLWLWLPGYGREAQRKRAFEAGVRQTVSAYKTAAATGSPVIFSAMHPLYAVWGAAPELRGSLTFLEIDASTAAMANKGAIVERDVVRVHSRRFGFPRLVPLAELRVTPRFSIMGLEPAIASAASPEAYARVLFPQHCLDTGISGVTGFVKRTGLANC